MLKKLLPKPLYIRTFLFLTLIVTTTILFFSYALTQLFNRYAWEEIDAFSRQRVEQISINTDFTLKKLILYGLRMYEDLSIRGWLNSEQDNPSLQYQALLVLTDYMAIEPFIHSIYLVNPKSSRIFSSKEGVTDISTFSNQKLQTAMMNNQQEVLKFVDYSAQDESYLMLTIRANGTSQGGLTILLDKQLVQEYLLLLNNEHQSKIFIVNEDGKMLLGNLDEQEASEVVSKVKSNSGSLYRWVNAGTSWTVRYSPMITDNWTIYHMLPANLLKEKVSDLNKALVAISFVMLLILALAIYWNTRKNYKPFSELTAKLQKKLGHPSNEDHVGKAEYLIIDSGLDHLLNKMDQLDLSHKSNKRLVLEEHIRQWISCGKLHDAARVWIGQETALLNQGTLQVAVVQIEGYAAFSEQYDFSSRKLLKYGIGNISMEVMERYNCPGEFIDLGSNHLLLLISSAETTDTYEMLKEIKNHVAEWLRIPTTIAVSMHVNTYDNLSTVFKKVMELSMLRFLYGVDKIYTEADLANEPITMEPFVEERHVKELIQAVRLRDLPAIDNQLQMITRQMHGLVYQECKLQLTQIVYQLKRTFRQLGEMTGMDGIQQYLSRFTSLNDVMSWLKDELHGIIHHLNASQKPNRKEELFLEMIEYVKQHIFDAMLTVDELAEHISISSDYARRIFKEFHELSLSEYITFERVEQIKKMLLTTNMTVMEISDQCGFQSKSHFYTAFRKWTGLTPNQFRMKSEQGFS